MKWESGIGYKTDIGTSRWPSHQSIAHQSFVEQRKLSDVLPFSANYWSSSVNEWLNFAQK